MSIFESPDKTKGKEDLAPTPTFRISHSARKVSAYSSESPNLSHLQLDTDVQENSVKKNLKFDDDCIDIFNICFFKKKLKT